MEYRIRTEGLVKKYKNRTVVNEVSINFTQGEIVGLLGPNGAGKTTSFYMIVGLIKPFAGKIFLNDIDITEMPMYKRAQLGLAYLPQEASVFRQLTVEDNIKAILEFSGKSKQEQKEKLESLISEFNIEKVRRNKGNNLSGGDAAAWRLPAASPPTPSSSSSTSRLRAWTPSPWKTSRTSSGNSRTRTSVLSSPTTTCTKPSPSPTAPTCSLRAACSSRALPRNWPRTRW